MGGKQLGQAGVPHEMSGHDPSGTTDGLCSRGLSIARQRRQARPGRGRRQAGRQGAMVSSQQATFHQGMLPAQRDLQRQRAALHAQHAAQETWKYVRKLSAYVPMLF
jgi:hypothetical protein